MIGLTSDGSIVEHWVPECFHKESKDMHSCTRRHQVMTVCSGVRSRATATIGGRTSCSVRVLLRRRDMIQSTAGIGMTAKGESVLHVVGLYSTLEWSGVLAHKRQRRGQSSTPSLSHASTVRTNNDNARRIIVTTCQMGRTDCSITLQHASV